MKEFYMERETMDANSRPRRTLSSTLIEPFKQIKIGLYVMAITLGFIALAGYFFVMSFVQQYQHVMEIFNVVDPQTQWELVTNEIFIKNASIMGVLFIVFLVVLFFTVFRMTHKIYGPLVSVERFVDQIKDGQFDRRIVMRRGDELQQLAAKLNQMAETLEDRYGFPDRRRRDEEEAAAKLEESAPKVS